MEIRNSTQCKVQRGHLSYQRLLCALLFGLLLVVGVDRQRMAAAEDCIDDRSNNVPGGVSNDPTHPFTPIDAWIALPANTHHWYAFRDEGDGTDVMVRMTVLPANGASFRVFTVAQVLDFMRGETVDAVGAGAPLPALNDDLYWTGNFVQSGTYYLFVESSNRGLSNYMLSIRGQHVSFPRLSFSRPVPPIANGDYVSCLRIDAGWTAMAPIDSTTSLSQTDQLPAQTATPTPILSSPQDPLPAVGRLVHIAVDERHWYAFRDEGDDATIEIRADATPKKCITFALWTPAQLRLWQQNQPFHPVGEGTANAVLKADLFWTGSFVKSGIYYIVVDHDPNITGDCTYQLRVTGDDVSLIIPPHN